jgi:hypothetical protein
MLKKIAPFLLLPVLLAGCTATFTNLTPKVQPRNANNLYPVEVEFDTRQRTIRWETIQPRVKAGDETYPMQQVPLMHNRWECLIPLPKGLDSVQYQYKFNFLYNEFGPPREDTAISRVYILRVSE